MTSSSKLDQYTISVHRNLGRNLVAEELRNLGLQIEVHVDHFPEFDTEPEKCDADWVRDVTGRGWVIFTRNGNIRNNPLERRTFIECGARVFTIRNGSASAADAGPFVVGISLNGTVTFIDEGK